VANLLARVEVARDGATAEATASASEATDLASTDVAPEVTVATGHSELERVSSLNSTPINPQFLPDGDVPSAGEASTAADQELLAAAPLGSEVYAPINENPTGRVVSPDMPILPESGEYLPEAPNRFDGYTWPAQGVFTSGYGWRWGSHAPRDRYRWASGYADCGGGTGCGGAIGLELRWLRQPGGHSSPRWQLDSLCPTTVVCWWKPGSKCGVVSKLPRWVAPASAPALTSTLRSICLTKAPLTPWHTCPLSKSRP
jgi:hypothetical protein